MKPADMNRILKRSSVDYARIFPIVKEKMAEVKTKGDEAILTKYRERKILIGNLLVSKQDFISSGKNVSKDFKIALKQVIKNIKKVNEKQIKNIRREKVTKVNGNDILVWRKWIPLSRVGIYVPGGNANYPSS